MSSRRRSSVRVQDRESGKSRGPNGRRLCRFCSREVPPGRFTFCSDPCVHEWKLRSSSRYLRGFVYERDLGRCACGTDTRHQKIRVEDAGLAARSRSGASWRTDPEYAAFLKSEHLTVKEAEKSLWDADHIVEVADGGGECGISNYQTKCKRCHKLKSAESRRTRSSLKRATKRQGKTQSGPKPSRKKTSVNSSR